MNNSKLNGCLFCKHAGLTNADRSAIRLTNKPPTEINCNIFGKNNPNTIEAFRFYASCKRWKPIDD